VGLPPLAFPAFGLGLPGGLQVLLAPDIWRYVTDHVRRHPTQIRTHSYQTSKWNRKEKKGAKRNGKRCAL
jgi:hypothetical protein